MPPMYEQLGFSGSDPAQPRPRSRTTALQSFVLPPRPSHQMAVDATAEWDNRARIERGVVIEPTPNDGVDLLCEVIESPGRVPVKPP